MGYAAKSQAKQERKQGFEAVEELLADPLWDKHMIMAYAKVNEKLFVKIDEMDNASFCQAMADMRTNNYDVYRVFWWWRKAHEDAAKRGEEDGRIIEETRYAVFMVTQFLAEPFSPDWENDRVTLKPGVVPWITEPTIIDGLDHKTIKRWLWCWHDRDIFTEEDEITDRTGRTKAGERKFKHAHVMLEIPAKVPISTVARWFNVPPNQIEVIHGRGAFIDGCEYLPHESPKAVAQHKTHYDDDEMHASPGFDFRKELTDLQANRAKYGSRAGAMTPADTMRMHVLADGWTMRQCRDDDPLTYSKIRNTLPPLRLDYLMDSEPCPFRLNIYVDGESGIGKSSFCQYLAQAMFPDVAPGEAYFYIGGDERVTFDGYDGEPAVIWEEMRAADFIKQFNPRGTYRLLDIHPKKQAQQAKHSRVILTNRVNIINGIQPFAEFIDGLAGTYDDPKTGKHYESEDDTQAWRRMPMIIQVFPESFDVLINQGFVNNDLSSVKTMIQYNHVRGSMKRIMERLDGVAKEKVLLDFSKPVLDAVNMIQEKHDNKISDLDKLPNEFKRYGEVVSADEIKLEAERRFLREAEEYERRRWDALIEFAIWFWNSPEGPYKKEVKINPAIQVDPEAEYLFAVNKHKFPGRGCADYKTGSPVSETAYNLSAAINNFVDGELVGTFDKKVIQDAITYVWAHNMI